MDQQDYVARKLEASIARKGSDEAYVRSVLNDLIMSKIYVLLDRPWEGTGAPNHETRLLHVSDGDDRTQTMLALFTSQQAYDKVLRLPGNIFIHPALVDAPWAFLSIAPEAGIYINPNSPTGAFRIGPEVAQKLRAATKHQITGTFT